jgi:hypothetical protein
VGKTSVGSQKGGHLEKSKTRIEHALASSSFDDGFGNHRLSGSSESMEPILHIEDTLEFTFPSHDRISVNIPTRVPGRHDDGAPSLLRSYATGRFMKSANSSSQFEDGGDRMLGSASTLVGGLLGRRMGDSSDPEGGRFEL